MANGCQTPQGERNGIADLGAYSIDKAPNEDHPQGIGQLEGNNDIGLVRLRPAKILVQVRLQ